MGDEAALCICVHRLLSSETQAPQFSQRTMRRLLGEMGYNIRLAIMG